MCSVLRIQALTWLNGQMCAPFLLELYSLDLSVLPCCIEESQAVSALLSRTRNKQFLGLIGELLLRENIQSCGLDLICFVLTGGLIHDFGDLR